MNLNDLGEKQSKIISERIHHVEKTSESLTKAFKKLNYNNMKFVDVLRIFAKNSELKRNEEFKFVIIHII